MSISAFTDAQQSISERVTDLLNRMTLDEKIAQLIGVWVTELLDFHRHYDDAAADALLVNGIGQITRAAGASLLPLPEVARLTNRIQKFLLENTRLGIPAIVHEESCAGFMAYGATTFPQAIGLGATWEPSLIAEMTMVIRQQMRAVGAQHALAPVLDIARDPRWGRVEETFGEDPFLTSNMGLAYVRGLQGSRLSEGVAATGKHFLAHGLPEGGRNWAPVHVGERELREVFLTPFAAVIREGNIATMMNAYHELDGIPLGASREHLIDLLRGELGFDGVVASDYFTLRTLVDYHHVARDRSEAARMGLEAGIDSELPAAECYGEPLRKALASGALTMDLVDASVSRVLELKLRLGLFDHPYVDEGGVSLVINTPIQRELSRRIAQKSIVLLKNDGVLPLSKSLKSIAVIGAHADSARLLQGDYHYPSHLLHIFDARGATDAPNPMTKNEPVDWNLHFPQTVTVLDGLRAAVPDAHIQYARGCDPDSEDTSGFEEAVEAARAADIAVVLVGDQSGLGESNTVGESNDNANLMLPGVQEALLRAVHATGTPVVLVLIAGRPYRLDWAAEHLAAMMVAWLPAQEGGAALADVLFGDVDPGGRLPITFPRSAGQIPSYYYHKPAGGRSHWHDNYVDSSTKPLYAFGFGLSYTQFRYSDLSISHTHAVAADTVDISVTVTNVGARTGDEVVQLYIADPIASVTRPVKLLKGFQGLTLDVGKAARVRFALDMRHFAFYDRDMRYVVEPGQVEILVGSSSDNIHLRKSIEIVGETTEVEQVFTTAVTVA
jgi:beta-glucosidase